MALNIDKHVAEEVLHAAYNNRKLLEDITASKISDVLKGHNDTCLVWVSYHSLC